jgi:hypothetical protein
MGSIYNDGGYGIDVDDSGNVFTTGFFEDTVDFDPGAGIYNLISAGRRDVFVSKLNASGNLVWAKKMGGTDLDIGISIAVDDSGNVYTTGFFIGTVDFDPGVDTFYLTGIGNSYDIFVCKLNAAGDFVWAKKMGGAKAEIVRSIAVDHAGNVFTAGFFMDTVDFDPGTGTFNLISAGDEDIFVSKLNASGNFVWAKKMGGLASDIAFKIHVDDSGNVYTAGYFEGTADFDPGPGQINLTSGGSEDIFVSKLNNSGLLVWAKRIGGSETDIAYSLVVDGSGNVYITGGFKGTVDFDPGIGTYYLYSAGSRDIFVCKLNTSGNLIWAKKMGGSQNEEAFSIILGASGHIYTTGFFVGTADFDPGVGTFYLATGGYPTIFLSKLNNSGNFYWAKKVGGSGNDNGNSIAVDDSGNVFTTGYFSSTADFDPGSGTYNLITSGGLDIFVHKLGKCSNSTSSTSSISCNSYTSPSTRYTWTTSGTYLDTLPNAAGCDSIITINLTLNSTTDSISPTACNSYTSPSTRFTYTTSGTYLDTIPNAAGCDSVITILLNINTVDTGVHISSPTLTANATGAGYQWLDCHKGFAPISSASHQSYTATSNGNFAVAVTQNGCTDTSACKTITGLGIIENNFGEYLKIYPNPTDGMLYIDLGTSQNKATAIVRNALGQDVLKKSFSNTDQLQLDIPGEAGVYFVAINAGAKRAVVKVLKEDDTR